MTDFNDNKDVLKAMLNQLGVDLPLDDGFQDNITDLIEKQNQGVVLFAFWGRNLPDVSSIS